MLSMFLSQVLSVIGNCLQVVNETMAGCVIYSLGEEKLIWNSGVFDFVMCFGTSLPQNTSRDQRHAWDLCLAVEGVGYVVLARFTAVISLILRCPWTLYIWWWSLTGTVAKYWVGVFSTRWRVISVWMRWRRLSTTMVHQRYSTQIKAQFACEIFTSVLKASGAKISMDGKGRWADNVFVDQRWCSVKYEKYYQRAYESLNEVCFRIRNESAWVLGITRIRLVLENLYCWKQKNQRCRMYLSGCPKTGVHSWEFNRI